MSLDPKIMKKTQDTLGKIIKKPPLTDKLLGKPPFRFLHDIMTSVIKTTGFMKGLFTEAEMNSENVKDRDSKVAFLQKAIDMVSIATKRSLSVKPAKIVAGHEPDKTNEFLQALASAINANVDNGSVVDKVLNKAGDTAEEPKKEKSRDDRKKEGREKDDRKREKEDREEKKDRREKDERRDRRDKDKSRDRDDRREKSRDREREDRHRDKEDRHRDKEDRHRDKEDKHRDRDKDKEERHREREKERERRRRKSQQQIPTTNLDTFAEFLVADDSGGTSCSSTDLKEGYAEDPGAKLNEGQKTARANRPRAARPRPNRNIEVITDSISGDDKVLMEKKPDADSNEISDDFVQVKNKKRKSGTKSRMAMRKPDSESSPSPPKPSKIPVKLDKDGHRGPPKSRQGKRRSKESLQDYPVSPVKSKGRKRSSNENLLVWPTQKDEEAGKENEPGLMNGETAEPEQTQRVARPTSAKGSRRRREEDEPKREIQASTEPSVGEADLPPQVAASRKMGRPSSARPAPPRRKEQTMVENEPAMRLGSGKPANVIVDDGKNSEDEDETFVVEETAPPPTEHEAFSRPADEGDDEDHGGLVKNILESKKEIEGPQQTKKTEIERTGMTDAQRRKQREHVQKEVDKLRSSIQTLTRSANPLGKIMDYVQEDLDSMQKELERWKKENQQHQMDLKRERGVTDKAVEPLKAQLAEVDQAIKDQLDLIAATKANISKNDQKVEKLLQSVTRS